MNWLLIKLSARKCRGCSDDGFHTAHLTWIGRLRYLGRLKP